MANNIDGPTEQDNETIAKKNQKEISGEDLECSRKELRNDSRCTNIKFLHPLDGPQ